MTFFTKYRLKFVSTVALLSAVQGRSFASYWNLGS